MSDVAPTAPKSRTFSMVILDTNVLHLDPRMQSTRLRTLRDGASAIDLGIAVPEPVLDELRRQCRVDLEGALETIAKAQSMGERILGEFGPSPLTPDTRLNAIERLDAVFASLASACRVLPYPSGVERQLASWAIHRRKPFDDGGRGLIDALIWISVLREAQSASADIAFVTSNHKDFGLNGALHPELAADVVQLGRAGVVLFKDVDTFMSAYLAPRLPAALLARHELETGAHPLDLRSWLADNLVWRIYPEDLLEPILGFDAPDDGVAVHGVHLEKVVSLQILRALELPGERLSLDVRARCAMRVRFRFPERILEGLDHSGNKIIETLAARDSERRVLLDIEVAMLVSSKTAVESAEVVEITGPEGGVRNEYVEDDDEAEMNAHEG